MLCPNCGKDNQPGAVFCLDCGARLQPDPAPQPAPPPAPDEARAPAVSLGQFTLMELAARIPVVNLVCFCIWGFGDDVNPNKKNWARSRLIWMGISLGLSILAIMVGVGVFSALTASFLETF